MARIRSIKPDFFTSEVIASLPLSARLTFIGLWTYVDDNGVGLDNERLIVAAVWPLEHDAVETVMRMRADLNEIAAAGNGEPILMRYSDAGRRLLFITHWDEHQKVSHPRRARYPRPSGDPPVILASPSGNPPEDSPQHRTVVRSETVTSTGNTLQSDSGGFPEPLRPEQGAGSREQGAGKTTAEAVTTSVEGSPPRRIKLPEGKWMDDEKTPAPPDRESFEAERRRQMDALMREYPEVTAQ